MVQADSAGSKDCADSKDGAGIKNGAGGKDGAGSGDCTTESVAFALVTDDEATHRPQSGNILHENKQ
jgi:hypothetical protein